MHLHHDDGNMTMRWTAMAAVLLLTGLLLTACGGASKGASSATTAAAKAPAGQNGAHFFATVRECLQKDGITLPKRGQRKPGQGAPPSGGVLPLGGGPQLPKGVTQAQFRAALKKCGGGAFRRGGAGPGRLSRINSPSFRNSLSHFAACLRQHGINVPAPNTSGKGPIFNVAGIDTKSSKFRAAQLKCSTLLRVALGARGGTGSPPGSSGAPGSRGGVQPPAGG